MYLLYESLDEILQDFTSLAVDKKIRDMAKELEDFELLSSPSSGRPGWTTALAEADIASSGVADSFLKASHLTRTR